MADHRAVLAGYGAWLLARQLGLKLPPGLAPGLLAGEADMQSDERLSHVRVLLNDVTLGGGAPIGDASTTRLPSIFSLVAGGDPAPIPRRMLDIQLAPDPDPVTRTLDQSAATIWSGFESGLGRLVPGPGFFETFTALLARCGWAVPGTLARTASQNNSNDAEGVSVYEQFKAITALMHVLGENDDVLLIAGDIPNIQASLFTIGSKGAARALRGRSFYLQLLNDAFVRAILRELDLPSACVIYNAGGNFKLLARPGDQRQVEVLADRINDQLFKLHDGELFLALASTTCSARKLAGSSLRELNARIEDLLNTRKAQAFARLAEANYSLVFGPDEAELRACAACQGRLGPQAGAPTPTDEAPLCQQCASLAELARSIATTNDSGPMQLLAVRDLGAMADLPTNASIAGKPRWEQVLETFGYRYFFARDAHEQQRQAQTEAYTADASRPLLALYRLNTTTLFDNGAVLSPALSYGFRFLANTTPRIRQEDLPWLEEHEGEEGARPGDIRHLRLMAGCDSTGVERYGVLRMDIDSLGKRFRGCDSLLRISALSGALGVFFEGWLNTICKEVAQEWSARADTITRQPIPHPGAAENLSSVEKPQTETRLPTSGVGLEQGEGSGLPKVKEPYVIYAGGDDLFIVGPWDVLPALACRIRRDLGSYARRGYVERADPIGEAPVTMSAGIFAETAKFPIYQAAEQARLSLESAKRRSVWEGQTRQFRPLKDAITFLETTLSWEEFARAEELALKLARMIAAGAERDNGRVDRAPRALLQLLGSVAREYAETPEQPGGGRAPYGRWMPLLAYGLRRMTDRVPEVNKRLRGELLSLGGDALDLKRPDQAARWPTIRFLGMPVRWAEFLIRKGDA